MQLIERTILTTLVAELAASGFVPVKFWDGEEYQGIANPMDNAAAKSRLDCVIGAVTSVDEGTLHFAPVADLQAWGKLGVLLILGNGEDIISDYHCANSEFDAAIERIYDWISSDGADTSHLEQYKRA